MFSQANIIETRPGEGYFDILTGTWKIKPVITPAEIPVPEVTTASIIPSLPWYIYAGIVILGLLIISRK